MVGLFSNLDLYMQKDMSDIIDDLPVDEELRQALTGTENEIYEVLKLVEAYENMDGESIREISNRIGIEEGILVKLYLEAINWQNELMGFKENNSKKIPEV